MYQFLKNSLKYILPNTLIKRVEPVVRSILYLFYKGKNHQCPICKAHLRSFVQLPNNDLLCPKCASLPRTRRLYHLLKKRQLLQGKILHFSPPLSLYQKLRQITTIQYVSSDYENEFVADQQYDLTDINLPDASVNLFIAYHVLEHIEQDSTAMRELFRITKNGGQGLIQTPFKSGEIYEDFSIRTPADRLRHFGQHDHVRIYSVQGLVNRLTAVGFTVEILQFQEKVDNIYGFKTEEIVLEVHK